MPGPRTARTIVAAGSLLLSVGLAAGQEPDSSSTAATTPPGDETDAPTAPAEGGATLVPLPVVFYQPETGVGFGVAAR